MSNALCPTRIVVVYTEDARLCVCVAPPLVEYLFKSIYSYYFYNI